MAKQSKRQSVPLLEWLAAAIGLVVAVALLGIIGREAIRGTDGEVPVLEARLVGLRSTPAGYVALIEVANRSSQTAAAVQVRGTSGGEESEASIDYVPGDSRARAGLVFSSDPRRRPIELRVTGYQLP